MKRKENYEASTDPRIQLILNSIFAQEYTMARFSKKHNIPKTTLSDLSTMENLNNARLGTVISLFKALNIPSSLIYEDSLSVTDKELLAVQKDIIKDSNKHLLEKEKVLLKRERELIRKEKLLLEKEEQLLQKETELLECRFEKVK